MYIKMKEDLDMSDYYDFHSEEHYEESRMSGCPVLPEGIAPTPDPENRNFRHKKNRKNSLGKRIASLTLSAVLFGAIAAGTFQSINYFSDGAVNAKSSSENQEAASAGTSGTDTGLLKNTSASGEGTSNKGSLDVTDIAKEAMPSIVAITKQIGTGSGELFSASMGTEEDILVSRRRRRRRAAVPVLSLGKMNQSF